LPSPSSKMPVLLAFASGWGVYRLIDGRSTNLSRRNGRCLCHVFRHIECSYAAFLRMEHQYTL
jgi:hypothetical protein